MLRTGIQIYFLYNMASVGRDGGRDSGCLRKGLRTDTQRVRIILVYRGGKGIVRQRKQKNIKLHCCTRNYIWLYELLVILLI
jgi:hypothetical protein